jgi:hypothetical protein
MTCYKPPSLDDPQAFNAFDKIVRAVAHSMLPKFYHFHIDLDELISIASTGAHGPKGGAWKAHESYNGKTSYSTWIGRAARCALYDHLRRLNRHANAIEHLGNDLDYFKRFTFSGPSREESILEKIPARLNRETGTALSGAAYAAALAYRERHGLSWRGLWLRLYHDPALVAALGFPRCPARSSLHLAKTRLAVWYESYGN